jgi:membrane protease YdiL (CAAX protease family)
LKGADAALKRVDEMEKQHPPPEVEQDLSAIRQIYSGAEALDDASKQRLIDRHGFFGRLATVYGLPDKDPERAKVLEDANRSAMLMMVIGIVFLLLMVAIGAAVITAIVLAALGKFKRQYVPQPWLNSAFLEAFAVYLVSFILLGLFFAQLKLDSLAWDWVALVLIPLTFGYVRWRGVGERETRLGFGWYWGRGPHIEIPLGIFGYLAGVPVIVAGFFISLQLMKHSQVSPMHPIQKMLQGDKWHILNLYGIACVFAPVLEETMFRGALFNHMRRRWSWLISAPVVAFIFAAIHPQGWTLIPALGSIAIVLAGLREWRGSLWASITAHATNNFLVLSLALMAAR